MKLAERLRAGKYRPTPIPKPAPPETPKERFARKLNNAKSDFRRLLDKQKRATDYHKDFDFLDVPVHYYDFGDMFVTYDTGQYKYATFKYELKTDSWFYAFLKWLISESFELEPIIIHWSHDPDDDNSYSFRVRW